MGRATSKSTALLVVGLAALAGGGCRQGLVDQDQLGAAIGEVMADVDESTNGSGATAYLAPILRTPDALKLPVWQRFFDTIVPPVYAASCGQSAFSACTGGARTRSFDACTVGPSTVSGSVMLTFSATLGCTVLVAGDTVQRTAEFTLTGPYGGTLAVTSPGGGQTLTKTATGFDYTVQGMERVLTGPGGRKLFDIGTRTTAPIVITGTSRANLVVVSGALEVSHNLAGYKVTFVPENLAWSSSCNCAVAGRLTGTVSGGKQDGKSASILITSCGHADVTVDGDTESVTMDRCAAM